MLSKGGVILYTNQLYSKILPAVTDELQYYKRVTHKVRHCRDQATYKVT
jgi:hypothetical protein